MTSRLPSQLPGVRDTFVRALSPKCILGTHDPPGIHQYIANRHTRPQFVFLFGLACFISGRLTIASAARGCEGVASAFLLAPRRLHARLGPSLHRRPDTWNAL